MDLAVGDELVSVNGREPSDIIEYQQLIDGREVTLIVQREGEALSRKVTIRKDEGQPLGLSIQSRRRLIQKYQTWIPDQRSSNGDPLSLSPREL